MVHRSRNSHLGFTGITLLTAALVLSSCGGTAPTEEVTPVGDQGARATTVAGASTVSGVSVTPTATGDDFTSSGDATATSNVSVAVSPDAVTLGNIVVTLAVQPAQPAFDAARPAATPSGSEDQKANPQAKGYAVLGSTLRITNNFDPSQSAPADQPREVLRHVALQIKDKQSGQLIPHISVTMDLLRDGRPVLQDQALVPMVPAGGNVGQMQYGNNVKFPGKGEYQVFVHVEPSPLLGAASVGVTQFNVSIK